jgi:hypothetical protein
LSWEVMKAEQAHHAYAQGSSSWDVMKAEQPKEGAREKRRDGKTNLRNSSPTDQAGCNDAKRLESRKGAKEETTTGRKELEADEGVCEKVKRWKQGQRVSGRSRCDGIRRTDGDVTSDAEPDKESDGA